MNFQDYIRKFPDFPKKGIGFCDVSPLLSAPEAWQAGIDEMAEKIAAYKPDILAGIESRGFLMAAPVAYKLGIGFLMLRKKGKLPGKIIGQDYALEYGTDRIEIQADAVKPGQKVIVADDLLATGGTMAAGVKLLQGLGAEVPAAAVFIELGFLRGAERLGVPCLSLIRYDS